MSAKAPSEGQKVTAGRKAPVTREGPGAVPQGSLAAESQAFREANSVNPQDLSSARPHEGTHATTTSTSQSASSPSSGAPRHAAGPHGKNLKEDEGIATEDPSKNASFASEIGSADDPGRLAEQKFTTPGVGSAATEAGRERGIDGKTVYDALSSEQNA